MKCKKCGYEGDAEIGDFGFNRELLRREYYKCPKCGSLDPLYIDVKDHLRKVIRFPEYCSGTISGRPHKKVKKEVLIGRKVFEEGLGYHSIYCPICGYGSGGGLLDEDAEILIKELEMGAERRVVVS